MAGDGDKGGLTRTSEMRARLEETIVPIFSEPPGAPDAPEEADDAVSLSGGQVRALILSLKEVASASLTLVDQVHDRDARIAATEKNMTAVAARLQRMAVALGASVILGCIIASMLLFQLRDQVAKLQTDVTVTLRVVRAMGAALAVKIIEEE